MNPIPVTREAKQAIRQWLDMRMHGSGPYELVIPFLNAEQKWAFDFPDMSPEEPVHIEYLRFTVREFVKPDGSWYFVAVDQFDRYYA